MNPEKILIFFSVMAFVILLIITAFGNFVFDFYLQNEEIINQSNPKFIVPNYEQLKSDTNNLSDSFNRVTDINETGILDIAGLKNAVLGTLTYLTNAPKYVGGVLTQTSTIDSDIKIDSTISSIIITIMVVTSILALLFIIIKVFI